MLLLEVEMTKFSTAKSFSIAVVAMHALILKYSLLLYCIVVVAVIF